MNKYPYKFTLKKGKENDKLDDLNKTGEITLQRAKDNIEQLKKSRTEIESKIDFEDAKLRNVLQHHKRLTTKKISQLTEQDIQIIYIYAMSFVSKKAAEIKLKEINQALTDISEDTQEILNQTGLKLKDEK